MEIGSSLGLHTLNLNFSQGNGLSTPITYGKGAALANEKNLFSVCFLANYEEVYQKLSDLLCSIKNDKDLKMDIEMSKIEAENRKAVAFEKMASNIGGTMPQKENDTDYIKQLKGLKELLDEGVISQEEFEEKKKQLLQ